MGKHFKPSIKLEIVNKYFNSDATIADLSLEYSVHRSTIFKWIKIFRSGQDISVRKKGSGRKKRLI